MSIRVYKPGPGPDVIRELESKEELEELGDSWRIAGGDPNYGNAKVSELSEHQKNVVAPESETVIREDKDGNQVVELSEGSSKEDGSMIQVDPTSERARRFFEEEELQALEAADDKSRNSGKDYSEMREEMREELKEVGDKRRERQKERKIEELKEDYRDILLPDHLSKSISELSGEEYLKLQNELENKSHEDIESELEETIKQNEGYTVEEAGSNPDPVDPEIIEEAAEAFSDGSEVYQEIAEELEKEANPGIPKTDLTYLDDGKVRIETRYEELKQEIREHNRTEILEENGDLLIAEGKRGSI